MPKKSVVQYTCDRCTRVWYMDSDAPEPKVRLNLLLEVSREKGGEPGAAISYDCLCDSCSDTVKSLVKSLAPLKPREKRAKKKDESADKEKSSSTDAQSSTSAALEGVAASAASSAPAPSSAGANSGGVSRPASPPNLNRPR